MHLNMQRLSHVYKSLVFFSEFTGKKQIQKTKKLCDLHICFYHIKNMP